MSERVCAVIVTYNRKDLLRECLNAVLGQTRPPDHVLVVDNASTDGTSEMLKEEFPQVEVLRLPENQGGAGGFHEGMKRACEMGFEWIWLMDDDGLPNANTLEVLLEGEGHLFRGCLVLAKEKEEKLAFGVPMPGEHRLSRNLAEVLRAYPDGVIEGHLNPFNGCLLKRKVVEKVGLPLKELFIWGDENEYFLRSLSCGISVATYLKALFWHPEDRQKAVCLEISRFRITLPYSEDPRRMYLIVRNSLFNLWRYRGRAKALVKAILYFLLFPKKGNVILRAICDAIELLRRNSRPCENPRRRGTERSEWTERLPF